MGNLYIEVNHNGVWYTEDSIIGQQHGNMNDPWLQKIVSLIPYVGEVVFIRFRATRGVSYEGDISIDDINIFDAPNTEMALEEIINPNTGCSLSSTENIKCKVQNRGFNPLTSFQASYTMFGNTVTAVSYTHLTLPTICSV